MGPGVRGDLVTFRVHTLDNVVVLDIELPLVDVVPGDKERCFGVMTLEQVQNMLGKLLLWAVVEGESNDSRLRTSEDTGSAICDIAPLVTRN